jgi:hypothetical protein
MTRREEDENAEGVTQNNDCRQHEADGERKQSQPHVTIFALGPTGSARLLVPDRVTRSAYCRCYLARRRGASSSSRTSASKVWGGAVTLRVYDGCRARQRAVPRGAGHPLSAPAPLRACDERKLGASGPSGKRGGAAHRTWACGLDVTGRRGKARRSGGPSLLPDVASGTYFCCVVLLPLGIRCLPPLVRRAAEDKEPVPVPTNMYDQK